MSARLNISIWISALLRRANSAGAFATIIRKGDELAGAVLVIVRGREPGGLRLYRPATNMQGERIWLAGPPQSEMDINTAVEKRRAHDDDLWVVEIEDGQGRHFLTEDIEDL
ncbi:MAG: DUF1491 family protein [Maricaulaceae bacterium]